MKTIKGFIALSLLAVSLCGCSSDEPGLKINEPDNAANVYKRSVQDAIEIASQYSAQASKLSRSASLKVDKSNVSAIVSTTSRSLSDTLMYAVNFEDNNGYMIISANKATEPILAIIDNGNYQEDEKVEIDGFNYFMDNAANYVYSTSIGGINPQSNDNGPVDFIKTDYTEEIESIPVYTKRINVNYGLNWPENKYCPNKNAGCGPVAIAQALTYFQPEMSFDITFDECFCNHLTINWDEMLKHTNSTDSIYSFKRHYFTCRADSIQHDNLAILIRQIGVWCNSDYQFNPVGTSTAPYKYFGIANSLLSKQEIIYTVEDNFYDHLKDEGIALIVGGVAYSSSGHAWVMDGVASVGCRIREFKNYNPKTGEYDIINTYHIVKKYVHCNWGFNGKKNGYFLDGMFDSENGRNFESDRPIIINPEPFNPTSRTHYTIVYGNIYK